MSRQALDATAITGVVDACAYTSLRKASRVATSIFDQATESLGLKSTQLSILVTAALHGPTTIRNLAEETVMDPSSLSRSLPRLEEMGLIKKAICESRRSRTVTVTEAGFNKIREAVPVWQNMQAQMLKAIGPDEHEILLALLRRAISIDAYATHRTNGVHSD